MKDILKIIFPLFILSPVVLGAELRISSDLWCPYACDPKSDKPGFMVEIAKEVFEAKGFKIKYEAISWARAVQQTRAGHFDAIVGASKADVPGFVIPQIPTGELINYIWTLPENTWSYKSKDSIKGKKIAYINGYSYGEEFDYMVAQKNPALREISGNDALPRMIKMAQAKRIGGFIENPVVLNYTLLQMKKSQNLFKAVSPNMANDPDLYIAFSPKKAQSLQYAQMLDEGVAELRRSGKLKKLLEKYGLSDWAK